MSQQDNVLKWECVEVPKALGISRPMRPDREIRVSCIINGDMYGAAYRVSDLTMWSLANIEHMGSKKACHQIYRSFVRDCVGRLTEKMDETIMNEITRRNEQEAVERLQRKRERI